MALEYSIHLMHRQLTGSIRVDRDGLGLLDTAPLQFHTWIVGDIAKLLTDSLRLASAALDRV